MKRCEEVNLVVFHSANEFSSSFIEIDDSNKPMDEYEASRTKFASWLSIYGKLSSTQQVIEQGNEGAWLAPSIQSSLIKLFEKHKLKDERHKLPAVTVSLYSHSKSSWTALRASILSGAVENTVVDGRNPEKTSLNGAPNLVTADQGEGVQDWWARMESQSADGPQWQTQVRTRRPRAPSSHEPRA